MRYVIEIKHNWNKLDKKLSNINSGSDLCTRDKLILNSNSKVHRTYSFEF
jgi:hypothetical protein